MQETNTYHKTGYMLARQVIKCYCEGCKQASIRYITHNGVQDKPYNPPDKNKKIPLKDFIESLKLS